MTLIKLTGKISDLNLYTQAKKYRSTVPVYTIPSKSKAEGKQAFIPNYSDRFFQKTQTINANWILQRMKEIAAVNNLPQILVVDVAAHCEYDFSVAKSFADKANHHGQHLDLEMLKTFAYAHDIGRMATGGVNPRFWEKLPTPYHGVVGREIFIHFAERFSLTGNQELSRLCLSLAKVASSHTAGVGFTHLSNTNLGILPHNKTEFEDDLVWGVPLDYYFERLLVGVADGKTFYPSTVFPYTGTVKAKLNNNMLPKLNGAGFVFDKLVGKLYITDQLASGYGYIDVSPWKRNDKVYLELQENNKWSKMTLDYKDADILELFLEKDGVTETLTLPGFDMLAVYSDKIEIKQFCIASREAVHTRFDRFDPQNKANIDRAFDGVVDLVGEENRSLVDGGWFDKERVPK